MNSDLSSAFGSHAIAQARPQQALGHPLRVAMRHVIRTIRVLRTRMSLASQYHRELELLMHADDRMLADIGLSRSDVVTAAQECRGWHGRRDALNAAATRRDEAVAVSRARRGRLPHVGTPSLAPALPHAMEPAKFS